MAAQPLRFIHASDFHLHRPISGVIDVPEQLADSLVDAPYEAARRVFDTALSQSVDFVVLSGDLLDADRTGPRGPLFLVEQMQRLADTGIDVYWAGGTVDPPEAWPHPIQLPSNVHRFPVGRVETFTVERDGQTVARISGVSWDRSKSMQPSWFDGGPADALRIAVVHGSAAAQSGWSADPDALKQRPVDYWALGGQSARETLITGPQCAQYPGSPQGRSPDEPGPHGCTLVELDGSGAIRTQFCPCDSPRWLDERIVVDELTSRDTLESMLRERMHTLRDTAADRQLLIRWTIAGSGPLLGQLRDWRFADELLGRLRTDDTDAARRAWTVALRAEPTASLPPDWFEQETIRGDYLRALKELDADSDEGIDLTAGPPDGVVLDTADRASLDELRRVLTVDDPGEHRRLLREAALLGVDLLTGEP